MKKVLACLLVCLLFLTLLVSCADSKPTPSTAAVTTAATTKASETTAATTKAAVDTTGTTTTATTAVASTASTTVADDGLAYNKTGLPIMKAPTEFNVMVSKSAIQGDWQTLTVTKYLEEKTNMLMVFNQIPDATYQEKKNLAFASGDLPEMFLRGTITQDDESSYGPVGILVNLLDYQEYAPNFFALMAENAYAKAICTTLDGGIYSFPYMYDTLTMANQTWINATWLKELNLSVPDTTTEFYDVLTAFKAKDPEIIPYSPLYSGSIIEMDNLACAFGVESASYGLWMAQDGKVLFVRDTENYKAFLEYLHRLYAEGLLDNEAFSQTYQQVIAKGTAGRLGVCPDITTSLPQEIMTQYEGLPPLTSDYNPDKVRVKIVGLATGAYAITSQCAYPEAAVRWADLFYTTDVDSAEISSCTLWLGIEDYNWKYTNAEKTKYTRIDQNAGTPIMEALHKYHAFGGAGGMPMYVYWHVVPDGDIGQELKAQAGIDTFFPYMTVDGYPPLRLTREESQNLAVKSNDVNTYINQMDAKFVIGEASFDDWDDFIATARKMGIDDMQAIQQLAYDRWMSFIG